MVYLVCENCGSYYELKKGDSQDIVKCSCGGKLRYTESIYGDSSKSFKKRWNDQSKSVKIIIILLTLTSIFLISLLFIAVAFPHYDGSEFSFDYPRGWIIDNSFPDMVTGTKGPENKFSILKVYDTQIYYLMVASLSRSWNPQKINIDGLNAYKFNKFSYGAENIKIWFIKGDYSYCIEFSGNSDEINQFYEGFVKSFHTK